MQNTEGSSVLGLILKELSEEVAKLEPHVLVTTLNGHQIYLPVCSIEPTLTANRAAAQAPPCSSSCRCAEESTHIISQLKDNPEQFYVVKICGNITRFPITAIETLKADIEAYKVWRTQTTVETPN